MNNFNQINLKYYEWTTLIKSNHSPSKTERIISFKMLLYLSLILFYTIFNYYRYKRDDLLSFYRGNEEPPEELKSVKAIFVPKSQIPIGLQFCVRFCNYELFLTPPPIQFIEFKLCSRGECVLNDLHLE